MQRNEHRRNPRGLADLLLPDALIDDGILLQQDGSLLTGWTYRGPDMMSAPGGDGRAQCAVELRAANGKRLDGSMRRDRSRAPGYPERGAFPDCVTRIIDESGGNSSCRRVLTTSQSTS